MVHPILILLSLASLVPAPALACSPMRPEGVPTDAALAVPGELPPPAPAAVVREIRRGGTSDFSSCRDIGMLVVVIPATTESRALLYRFERKGSFNAGADQGPAMPTETLRGDEIDGQLRFLFPWVDGVSRVQEPLSFTLRVTAVRPSGQKGGHVDVRVHHPGHSGAVEP